MYKSNLVIGTMFRVMGFFRKLTQQSQPQNESVWGKSLICYFFSSFFLIFLDFFGSTFPPAYAPTCDREQVIHAIRNSSLNQTIPVTTNISTDGSGVQVDWKTTHLFSPGPSALMLRPIASHAAPPFTFIFLYHSKITLPWTPRCMD